MRDSTLHSDETIRSIKRRSVTPSPVLQDSRNLALLLLPAPCIRPQPMSLSLLHAYLVSLVTDRQLDTSKTERGGRTKSNGDRSCIVTSVSQDNLSLRKRESERASEREREVRHLLSDRARSPPPRGQFIAPIEYTRDVSDKDI